jgi:hypothetical protein
MCIHTHTTLVQAETKDHGPFITYQCDVCGAALPDKEIEPELFDAWMDLKLDLPRMDYTAYRIATDRQVRSVFASDTAKLEQLAKLVRR